MATVKKKRFFRKGKALGVKGEEVKKQKDTRLPSSEPHPSPLLKGEGNKKVFPKIFRFITEPLKLPSFLRLEGKKTGFFKKEIWIAILSLVLVGGIVLISWDIKKIMAQKRQREIKRAVIMKQIQFWQDVVNKHPDYRDGYFQIALLEYRIGDMASAKIYADKTLQTDPNFQDGVTLERLIKIKGGI